MRSESKCLLEILPALSDQSGRARHWSMQRAVALCSWAAGGTDRAKREDVTLLAGERRAPGEGGMRSLLGRDSAAKARYQRKQFFQGYGLRQAG